MNTHMMCIHILIQKKRTERRVALGSLRFALGDYNNYNPIRQVIGYFLKTRGLLFWSGAFTSNSL